LIHFSVVESDSFPGFFPGLFAVMRQDYGSRKGLYIGLGYSFSANSRKNSVQSGLWVIFGIALQEFLRKNQHTPY